MKFLLAWGLLIMSAADAAGEGKALTPAQELLQRDKTLIIAHRGASGVAPENTRPAFRRATEVGVDLVELDYYHSLDGVPLVFHDKDLKRTTNAKQIFGDDSRSIASLTLEEARRLDVGSWFSPQFAGTHMLTLEQSLDEIQARGMTLIERKQGDAATCVEMLRQKKLLGNVVVQAFDWDYLRDCRRLAPDLVLGALGDKELTEQRLQELEQLDVQAVGWSQKYLTPKDITALHEHGFKVWAYTVNEVARANELLDANIDGIITDFPERIKPMVNKH
jgi:glycerophosphoryl diester phosphodiesterase